eukprot:3594654-Rhodomonas_salina.1
MPSARAVREARRDAKKPVHHAKNPVQIQAPVQVQSVPVQAQSGPVQQQLQAPVQAPAGKRQCGGVEPSMTWLALHSRLMTRYRSPASATREGGRSLW